MATIVSPGVSVTVTDESFYSSAGPGTVPMIFIATKQDKATPDGTAVASGTTAASADSLFLISSQRELLQTFGNPDFNEVGGTSQHGYALNEYGLLAAYSYLGVANRAYVVRADVDLAELEPTATEPAGDPANGTYWVDMNNFVPGLFSWNSATSTGVWEEQTVTFYDGVVNDGDTLPSSGFVNGDFLAAINDSFSTSTITYFERLGGAWLMIGGDAWSAVNTAGSVFVSPHTSVPTPTPSIQDRWVKTTTPNAGLSTSIKMWDSTLGQFVTQTSPTWYEYSIGGGDGRGANFYTANAGSSVAAGTLIGLYNDHTGETATPVATLTFYRHNGQSTTTITGLVTGFTTGTLTGSDTFYINGQIITLAGDETIDQLVQLINATPPANVVASKTSANGAIVLTNTAGEDIYLYNGVGTPLTDMGLTTACVGAVAYTGSGGLGVLASNMVELATYDSTLAVSLTAPTTTAAYGTYWYDPSFTVDIMEKIGSAWNDIDPNLILVQSDEPTTQLDGTALAGDELWVETDQLTGYPVIRRYVLASTEWVLIDNADQTTPNGIIFADARAAANVPGSGTAASTATLDGDAPLPAAYPVGTLLFNTRASGRNVKVWTQNATTYSSANVDRWVSASGLQADGSPYMGQDAVKRIVIDAMASVIASNEDIRAETVFFNLIAAPGFPELMDEMLALNVDRKETAFVIGDSPFHLSSNTTDLQNWATNANNAASTGDDGLVTNSAYLGVYYPSCLTANVDGSEVVAPASHIVLRTMAYNDQVAYQWFAPAGFSRGLVSNAASVGYLTSEDEYTPVTLNQGQRDVLYTNKVNPIAYISGRGLVVYGQKTRNPVESALDRINVARLTNFVRFQSEVLGQPFLFEPNDTTTRDAVKAQFDSFLAELVTLRGLYAFLVVCDESNNTPARIDRNELWIDIAIQPVKAVEFIYIPIRIRNTGESLA
jgi:hypothetical protein